MMQKLKRSLPQQGTHTENISQNNDYRVKISVLYFKSYIIFFWTSVERLECTKLLASALMNLNRWIWDEGDMSWRIAHLFCYLFPRTSISNGTSQTELRCCDNGCKLLEATLVIAYTCQFTVAVSFSSATSLSLESLLPFNNTDRVPVLWLGKKTS